MRSALVGVMLAGVIVGCGDDGDADDASAVVMDQWSSMSVELQDEICHDWRAHPGGSGRAAVINNVVNVLHDVELTHRNAWRDWLEFRCA